ncbi:hypothetical protein [Neolewinella antarctica]|uniref:Uncharacterized protein n=1 Tax=Neolewinella antarctica TaxID=442734 RepID=A0ABX0X6P6_9BACT|nr:hypothetical protein [Neolewinella antarctica]NJC24664.1 hypothetical protein [Neolewinella antarctica]
MTIDPQQTRPAAEDYAALRAAAYAAVEELGHEGWTDYNAHDPGITILEALAYSLAETGYRAGFDVADLLTAPDGKLRSDQGFYPARQILTAAPLTDADFRRLLIDAGGIRNAWLSVGTPDCSPPLYPACEAGEMDFAPRWRTDIAGKPDKDPAVRVGGIHDVLIQLAPDIQHGNLNSDVMATTVQYAMDGQHFPLELELWFPRWRAASPRLYRRIVAAVQSTGFEQQLAMTLRVTRDSAETIDDQSLQRNIRGVFFLDYELRLSIGNPAAEVTVRLANVALRVRAHSRVQRGLLTVAGVIQSVNDSDLLARYFARLYARRLSFDRVRDLVRTNRKVGEDFCRITHVHPLPIGVCAELHLDGTTDLELALAAFYRVIERFLNPAVPFRTLDELVGMGLPTEDIFTGPALDHGFILEEDLTAAALPTRVAISDLIGLVMDVPGVRTVEGLRFTTYDREGKPQCTGKEWAFHVPAGHYPELYLDGSAISVYRDGLPLQPRRAELRMLLNQLRNDDVAAMPDPKALDYPVPRGRYVGDAAYLPIQRTLPEVYGLGITGLPAGADAERRAQGKQLAGYLHPLENIAAATAKRVGDFADLFSTDATLDPGWTDPALTDPREGVPLLLVHEANLFGPNYTQDVAQQLLREGGDAAALRGSVLDHLLARYGEEIQNYVALVHDVDTREGHGVERLNANKAGLLKGIVASSARRGTRDGLSRRLDDLLFTEGDGPIIIEHVRLRPKFPGDAVMEVCLSNDCDHRGRDDAYSFRLTYLFNGEASLYNEDMELRRYANRLIRRQTPVHLLPKICWSSAEVVEKVTKAYEEWNSLDEPFDWADRNAELRAMTARKLALPGTEAALLLGYFGNLFRQIVVDLAEAEGEPTLLEPAIVESLFTSLREDLVRIRTGDADLAHWRWVDVLLRGWLTEALVHYQEFLPVTLALNRLLAAIAKANSVYPVATLHDCDDGDDGNPVRLGATSLGNFNP